MKIPLNLIIVAGLLLIPAFTYAQKAERLWETEATLMTCESALYDAKRDRIYVSNINGQPSEKNGKGSISIIDKEGKITNQDWITGLNAPKGMAMAGDNLFIADLTELVIVDLKEGKVGNKVEMPGSSFLNDVSVGPDGKVYITDSNKKVVYSYDNGEIEEHFAKEKLVKPNGIVVDKSGFTLIDMGSGVFYTASPKAKKLTAVTTGLIGGDGIIKLNDKEFITSNWNGEIWYVKLGSKPLRLVDTKESKEQAADLGFIPGSNILLVPTFFANKVVAYKITGI